MTLIRPEPEERPFTYKKIESMVPCLPEDINVGKKLYILMPESSLTLVTEHVVRDRVMAERKFNKVYGEDESLQSFKEYKDFLLSRQKKQCLLIIR